MNPTMKSHICCKTAGTTRETEKEPSRRLRHRRIRCRPRLKVYLSNEHDGSRFGDPGERKHQGAEGRELLPACGSDHLDRIRCLWLVAQAVRDGHNGWITFGFGIRLSQQIFFCHPLNPRPRPTVFEGPLRPNNQNLGERRSVS